MMPLDTIVRRLQAGHVLTPRVVEPPIYGWEAPEPARPSYAPHPKNIPRIPHPRSERPDDGA